MNTMIMRTLLLLLSSVSLPSFCMLVPATRSLVPVYKGMARGYMTKKAKITKMDEVFPENSYHNSKMSDFKIVDEINQKEKKLDVQISWKGNRVSSKQLALQGLQKVQACTKDECACYIPYESPSGDSRYDFFCLYEEYKTYKRHTRALNTVIMNHAKEIVPVGVLCPNTKNCAQKIIIQDFLRSASFAAISIAGIRWSYDFFNTLPSDFSTLDALLGLTGMSFGSIGVLGSVFHTTNRATAMCYYLEAQTNEIKKILDKDSAIEQKHNKINGFKE